jgi:hypothetical protein
MWTRLQIAAMVFMMVQAVLFGMGMVSILATPFESKRDDAGPLDDRVELHCLCAAIVADCASASATLLAQASREWRRSLWLILAVVMGPLCPGKPSRTVVTEPAVKDEPETART